MRTILGCAMLALLSIGAGADVKKVEIDAKMLIGKWKGEKVVMEFMKDDKATVLTRTGAVVAEGTYKVEGNLVTISKNVDDKEGRMTITISKLTDTELVIKSKKGEGTLTRAKADK